MNVLRQYIIQLRVALLMLCISMAADSLCQQPTAAGDTPVASQSASQVAASQVAASQAAAPQVAAPQSAAPQVAAPQVAVSQTAATPAAVSQAAAATEAASATISTANWIGQPSLEKARYYEVSTVKPKTLFYSHEQQKFIYKAEPKQVVLMWSTDYTDPAYKAWTNKIAEAFNNHGVNVELHSYFGTMGFTYEAEQSRRITLLMHELDTLGKRPDLIMANGDYIMWLLMKTPDAILDSVPMVCYGLKDTALLQMQFDILKESELAPKHIVEIHDTLMLQKGLDFVDFLEGFQPLLPHHRNTRSHRFVGLLDNNFYWPDSLYGMDLKKQMRQLDPLRYLNCIDSVVRDTICVTKNKAGVISLALASFKEIDKNVMVLWHPLTWMFYRQKSQLRFIQLKHDEVSRSLSEGPNLGAYYTFTAEDFLTSDSCVGGFFSSADTLIHDAVEVGVRLMNGEPAEEFGRMMHHPDYHVNWDLLRPYGHSVKQMPDYVHLYNATFVDYYPILSKVLFYVGIVLFIALIITSLVYSVKGARRQMRNRKALQEQAQQAIYQERLLELALQTCDAIVWDDSEGMSIMQRITVPLEWTLRLQAFFANKEPGLYQLQFKGSIDGQPEHWYEIRMDVHYHKSLIHRRGYVVNIDKMKEVEQMAAEAHQMLLDARTREGFLSSMNHEIRTPLHAVVGFSMELARVDAQLSDEDIAAFADIIETNAAMLTKIINDILLVTLMRNANVSAHVTSCKLHDLLDSKHWHTAMEVIQRRKNDLHIQPADESVVLQADSEMVAAVIDNLLLNASTFSQEGSRIELGWKASDKGVEIWVKDEGIGIEKAHFPMLYKPFFKINSFSQGAGLGLHIAETYMQKMGGSIRVESEPGKGSIFTISFPA